MTPLRQGNESGFTLSEFLTAACILLVISASVFRGLSDTQYSAAYQSEVQAVLDNTRVAMQLIERHIRQAGNDPFHAGISGITVISDSQLRIRSDLTGSGGAGNPDKGDPDGDTADSSEDVTIRYNQTARTVELVPDGGPAQSVAGYISGLSFQCLDENGNPTNVGSQVRRIKVSISGSSLQPNPETHEIFGVQITGSVEIAT
jgi:type II secretory pathway pseudopilin PulG